MHKIIPILFLALLIPIVSFASEKTNPFGVLTFLPWNEAWNNYMYKNEAEVDNAIALLKDLGVSTIRVDFSWENIERKQGVYDFKRLDYIISVCQKNNIGILGVIGYSPSWIGKQWNEPPSDIKPLLKFITVAVKRYPYIKYWEFWNEPDSQTYWQPQDDMKTYVSLLKAVYPSIKAANPQSAVLLGGLTRDGFYAFKSVLRLGGGDYFDIVNFHPFVDPNQPDGFHIVSGVLELFRKELQKYNLNKKIWLTEVGCPGRENTENCSWWLGPCQNEQQQAEFLKKAYACFLAQKDVDKIFWAFFQDTNAHFNNGVDSFGLIRADFSKKPAYLEYKKIIDEWKN
jgi:hypothetical protein